MSRTNSLDSAAFRSSAEFFLLTELAEELMPERQTEFNGTTCRKRLRKENPTTTTNGNSGMVTKQNYREEISERDTSKDNNGRALVQEEQVGVQLPKCGRMEFDSASIKPLKGYDTSDASPKIGRHHLFKVEKRKYQSLWKRHSSTSRTRNL